PESRRGGRRRRRRGCRTGRQRGRSARGEPEGLGGPSPRSFAFPSDVPLRSPAPSDQERTSMADASLTWLGHASFRLDSPGGKRVYVDPWFDNPKCPDAEKDPDRCDVIAATHGHGDHVGSGVDLSKEHGPVPIVAMVELKSWLKDKGAKTDDIPGPNKGGTVEAE